MKHHAAMGRNILKGSLRLPLRSAAIIAGQHHEHWDGSGYPLGLIGEEIHIFGRIVALADVFDALCNTRVYKEAWPLDTVIAHVKERAGTQFDPQLIAVFLEHIERFVAILNDNPNESA
jgi:HD-GYP domain-containing protein (c-di-GMP phosphodiesterase class II)